jgi:hypothetical protein
MRINQNIGAFNAYRNLSVTNGQQGKSLEKGAPPLAPTPQDVGVRLKALHVGLYGGNSGARRYIWQRGPRR